MAVLGEYMQAVCRFGLAGWPVQINTFGFVIPTGSDFDDAVTETGPNIVTAWVNNLETLQADTYTFDSITFTDYRTATGGQTLVDVSQTAGNVAHPLPPGTALVVSLKTAQRGRSFRGRTFIGGLTEASNEDNATPDATIRAACESFITDLRDLQAISVWDLAIVSQFSGVDGQGEPIPRATAVVTPVTTVIADDVWDRQRRRGLAL